MSKKGSGRPHRITVRLSDSELAGLARLGDEIDAVDVAGTFRAMLGYSVRRMDEVGDTAENSFTTIWRMRELAEANRKS